MELKEYPTLSVVVPCFNVEHVVERCIDGLLSQDYPKEKYTIIIIDDKSTDTTGEKIHKYENNDQIKIVKHFQNRGLSATRNSGIKASKSQIIGFLDSDIVVHRGWIKAMMHVLENDSVVACMGDTILAKELPQNKIDKFLYHPKRGVRQFSEEIPIEVPGFIMGNSFVKRKAITEIGMFDETIRTWGGEDTDLALRLWRQYPKGLRFTSKAIGDHYHKRELNNLLEVMETYGSTNYLILLDRYPEYNKRLAGDWIHSFKGIVILNPVMNLIIRTLYLILPMPRLIRYFIAHAVIKGARNPAKGAPPYKKIE